MTHDRFRPERTPQGTRSAGARYARDADDSQAPPRHRPWAWRRQGRHIDPAAAPLGTDEEAAGTAPPREAIAQAHDEEVVSGPVSSERRDGDNGVAIYVAVISAILIILGASLWLVRLG